MAIQLLIVEDEAPTARRLAKMLTQLMPDGQVAATLQSVRDTVAWLSANPQPSLAFFDIQLADGISFEVFEQVKVNFPVIFTTAFNDYAIKAFKVNSIDYLLKPVKEEELKAAIDKFRSTTQVGSLELSADAIARAISMLTNTYKSRFMVKIGEHIRMIPIEEVALFYSSEKSTYIRTLKGRDYDIDLTLDQVMIQVNPTIFFRVSRKYIISLHAITDIIAYSGSRLKVKLTIPTNDDVLVSRERVNDFKAWLDA
jgi:DNA-binding LytR/AlgR family response regulator